MRTPGPQIYAEIAERLAAARTGTVYVCVKHGVRELHCGPKLVRCSDHFRSNVTKSCLP